MDRRTFLRSALAGAGTIALGDGIFRAALATEAGNADASSYGPLRQPDLNGLQYPQDFRGSVIARSGTPVGLTPFVWPVFPDGSACFPSDDGGWILVVNSENPPAVDVSLAASVHDLMGGASAVVFDSAGKITDAYSILTGTRTNCAGGVTPWGTWLSCEEFDYTTPGRIPGAKPADAGRVWECSPTNAHPARELPLLGRFKHEAATFDDDGRVYLTEDMPDGCLYRFTPTGGGTGASSLNAGVLEALKADFGTGVVTWTSSLDPTAATTSTRKQATHLGATAFKGGEGCYFHNGVVLFTTKGDDRVWALTLGSGTAPDRIEVLYDGAQAGSVLTGVDNIIVSEHTGNIYVAEDGANMEVVVIETTTDPITGDPTRTAAPLIRATGPQHGTGNPTPVPTASEVVGLALSPDGTRLYFSGQRTFGIGITYEVKAPAGTTF